MNPIGAVALALGIGLSLAWPQASHGDEGGPSSPRLRRVSTALAEPDTAALTTFWGEVRSGGTPLIEPSPDSTERLVTFLWQSSADTRVVVLTDFGDFVPHMTFERLGATDVWYRTLRLPADARFLYQLSVDDPEYPFVDGDIVRFPAAPQPDPLNPRQYDFARPDIHSLVELPDAPALAMSTPDSTIPRGVVGRFPEKLRSAILGNERDVFIYQPPGYSRDAQSYPLLVFPASYINQIRLPVILDHLIARRQIPAVVAVLVGFPPSAPGKSVQDEEAGGGEEFGKFIATELLPWVRARVNVTADPRRTVIGGASAGGHSAAFVALRHADVIGNVIAQSGAFWRGIGHTASYWADPAHADGREGLATYIASRADPASQAHF